MALNLQCQPDLYRPVMYEQKKHMRNSRREQVASYQSSDESANNSYSDSEYSDYSDELEPAWNEEPMRAGELFYVEDSPDVPSASDAGNGVLKTNHQLPTGTLKHVFIGLNSASVFERKLHTNFLASMLGIITLEGKIKGRLANDRIVVDALVPGGVVIKTGQVFVGDVLIAINDLCVDILNIEKILEQFTQPSRIKLTFQCVEAHFFPTLNDQNGRDASPISTVQLLSPNRKRQNLKFDLSGPNGLFFLTLNIHSDNAAEYDDILYSYPSAEASSTLPTKLLLVRGLFVTLSDVIQDTFKCQVLSSSLLVEEKLVHCAYHHVKTEVMVLCLPAENYSLPQVHRTMSNTVRLLTIMYGSVLQAFQPENRHRLDHLFEFMLILNASSGMDGKNVPGSPEWKFPGTELLRLSPDLTAHANSALAELEACDFDDGSSGRNYKRRLYTIKGSCVFFDGHLLANHLPISDLNDITLFCHNHALLGLRQKERIGLLLIWREVFPWFSRIPVHKDGQYIASKGRTFWMFVGLKHSLLCVLLQMNGDLFPNSHTPRPDPMYVNKARATLLNMETCHFQECVSQRLQTASKPYLTQPDRFLQSASGSLFKASKPPSGNKQDKSIFPSFSSPLKPKQSSGDNAQQSQQRTKKSLRESIGEKSPKVSMKSLFREKSVSSQGSDEIAMSPKTPKKQGSAYSLEDIEHALGDGTPPTTGLFHQLPVGAENTLFCYLSFNKLEGILLVPTAKDQNTVNSPLHKEIVTNFKKHCLLLHQRFKHTASSKDRCTEEGILFHCHRPSAKSEVVSKLPHLQYWVVGRVTKRPVPKEVYVCFNNSSSQSMVELAFRML